MRFSRRTLSTWAGLVVAVVLASTAVASAFMEAASSRGLDSAAVDQYVSDYLDTHGLPGAAVAVVKDGKTVHEAGYGRDSRGEPLTESTRLRIASVSKPITAFAVLQLVDDGDIALDAPVTSYLPKLALDDQRIDKVTVRQLLSHTSGIETPTVIPPAATLAEAVAMTSDWELASKPGTHYAYSNANYWIAARLVEVVSEQSFREYLDDYVFGPLDMTDSLTTPTTRETVPGLAPGHVTAYGLAMPAPEPTKLIGGAGGVVTTAHDLARWMAMQQRGGSALAGRQLLSEALVAESHQPQPAAPQNGLGWHLSRPGVDPTRVNHSGVGQTFQAQVDLVPSSGYGVVVMLNSFTIWREHAYAISSGIIEITQGGAPEVGPPVPTLVDLGLGVATLGVVALGVRGVRRSGRWAARTAGWSRWRRTLRLALRLPPHLLAPALACFLMVIAPNLQDNSLTGADVFRLAPAVMVLLVAAAVNGLAVVTSRVVAVRRQPDLGDRWPVTEPI